MGKRTIIGLAAAAFLCFGLAACAATAGSGSDASSPVGSWGSQKDGQPNLEFNDDGTVYGTDGCNRLTGNWEQDGAMVKVLALASTMMFCEGVDDWLNGAAAATISDTTMTIEDTDGDTIGTLERDAE